MRFHPALLACAALALTVACGGGGGAKKTPAGATPGTEAPTAVTSERGTDPIFWRTEDNFASLEIGQPYKTLFRITNGYAEPTLTVEATCRSCSPAQSQTITFDGQQAQPVGGDAPGTYYPANITLPYAGEWEIRVAAGADSATILVVVSGASAG
jgi:hypothetical protein